MKTLDRSSLGKNVRLANKVCSEENLSEKFPNNQLGALNLLTAELMPGTVGLVRRGRVYSLSVPLEEAGPQWPTRHKTWPRVTIYCNNPSPGGFGACDDVIAIHSHSGTHINALCHACHRNLFRTERHTMC